MIDVEKMRQKILDLAIRGKLVPQDPNEEPASALLERIRAEQEKLYKEGKIKKLPDFSYIYRGSDNRYYEKRGVFEKDFDVPVNWAIIKLSSIGTFGGGKTPSTGNPSFWGNEVNWTTSKDVKTKYIFESQTRLTKKGAEELQIYPINTLVLVTRSGILRHTVPISILSSPSTVNQDIKTISLGSSYLSEWIYLFFKANERKILSTCSKDGTTVESLDFDKIKNLQIPIAPKEQIGRIIGSVDEAFKKLDTIYAAQKELDSFSILLKKKVLNSIFSSDKSYYPKVKLGDALCYLQPGPYIVHDTEYAANIDEEHSVPVLTPGKTFVLGYTNEKHGVYIPSDKVIIFDDFTTASRLVDFPFKVKSSAMKILVVHNPKRFDISYLFNCLQTIHPILGTHKRFWISEFSVMSISAPPLDVQKKKVKFVELFEKLIASLN